MPVAWSPIGAGTRLSLTSDAPLGPTNPVALCITAAAPAAEAAGKEPAAGVANSGFWGISLQPHSSYHVSLYLKRGPGSEQPVKVGLLMLLVWTSALE